MPGDPAHRGRRIVLVAVTAAFALAPLAAPAAGAPGAADGQGIRLPVPVREVDPLATPDIGLRKDRLLRSQVPGRVSDIERVLVALGPTGAPTRVTDTQRLVIHGAGSYIVRELGPAREAEGLGDTVPPVLELGTVVWQGFSPGRRSLTARLTLDPGIEAARLPMSVRLTFRRQDGRPASLGPGARAPANGTVTVTLTNNSTSNRVVSTGTAEAKPLAKALDKLRAAAARPRAAVPPTPGAGLPRRLPGTPTGELALAVVAPLRVTGTITAPGGSAAITGPATTPTAGGASITGTLNASAQFDVAVRRGDRIGLRLDVRPWLDDRTLSPPRPATTWREWARVRPSDAERAAATRTLVTALAASARSAEYSPYLQADAPGPDLSTFTYVVASAPRAVAAAAEIQPRPGAIAAAAVALLAIIGNAALLRRRL